MIRRVIAASALLLFFTPAHAGEDEAGVLQRLDLNGSLRASYYGASRTLDGKKDVGSGALWLKSSPSLRNDVSLNAEGWVRNDASFSGKTHAELREGYLNYTMGDADWRIGKQIIVWGRADGINPTDNLTPRNHTLLTPENDDQRLGALAAKMSYHFQDVSLTGIWLPRFSPSVFPIAAQPGVFFSEQVPDGGQGALKLDRSGGEVDWSVSYFNGYDLNPDLKIGASGPSGTNLILQHRRIRVLGADGATAVGRYGLRAEAAYTWTEDAGGDPLVKQPFLYAVLGGDRTYYDNFNVNLQYYFRRITNYSDPQSIADPLLRGIALQGAISSNQMDRFQYGFALRFSNKWLNETLEGEIAGIFSMTDRDYALKPKLAYAFNDLLKGTFGMDIYRGASDTLFGRMRDNTSAFAELKYSF